MVVALALLSFVPQIAWAEPNEASTAGPPTDRSFASVGAHVSLGAPLHSDAVGTRTLATTVGGRFGGQLVPAFGVYADLGVTFAAGGLTGYTSSGSTTGSSGTVILGLSALASIRPIRFLDLSIGPMVGLARDPGAGAQGRLSVLFPIGHLRLGPGAEVIAFHEPSANLVTLCGMLSVDYVIPGSASRR